MLVFQRRRDDNKNKIFDFLRKGGGGLGGREGRDDNKKKIFDILRGGDNKNKIFDFLGGGGRGGGALGAERKISSKTLFFFFRGKRHDNKILKVQILLSRNLVVMAQPPSFAEIFQPLDPGGGVSAVILFLSPVKANTT